MSVAGGFLGEAVVLAAECQSVYTVVVSMQSPDVAGGLPLPGYASSYERLWFATRVLPEDSTSSKVTCWSVWSARSSCLIADGSVRLEWLCCSNGGEMITQQNVDLGG